MIECIKEYFLIMRIILICLLFIWSCTNEKKLSTEIQNPNIVTHLYDPKISNPFPESKYFIFGNKKFLHFREFIPSKKIKGNVLLIHGFAGSTYSFRKNINLFLELDYLVLALDLPNFGYSMRVKDWNHSNEFRASLIWKFINYYESQKNLENKKWIILGHSMGGVVATYMAQLFQEKTEKLILVSPALGQEPNSFFRSITYLPFLETLTKNWIQRTLGDKEKFGKILQSAYGIQPFFPLEEDIEGYRKPLLLNQSFEYIFDLVQNSKNQNPLVLQKILVPVIIFHGLNDTWIPINSVIKQFSLFPNSKVLTYSNVGHCPLETNANELNQDIKNVLQSSTL